MFCSIAIVFMILEILAQPFAHAQNALTVYVLPYANVEQEHLPPFLTIPFGKTNQLKAFENYFLELSSGPTPDKLRPTEGLGLLNCLAQPKDCAGNLRTPSKDQEAYFIEMPISTFAALGKAPRGTRQYFSTTLKSSDKAHIISDTFEVRTPPRNETLTPELFMPDSPRGKTIEATQFQNIPVTFLRLGSFHIEKSKNAESLPQVMRMGTYFANNRVHLNLIMRQLTYDQKTCNEETAFTKIPVPSHFFFIKKSELHNLTILEETRNRLLVASTAYQVPLEPLDMPLALSAGHTDSDSIELWASIDGQTMSQWTPTSSFESVLCGERRRFRVTCNTESPSITNIPHRTVEFAEDSSEFQLTDNQVCQAHFRVDALNEREVLAEKTLPAKLVINRTDPYGMDFSIDDFEKNTQVYYSDIAIQHVAAHASLAPYPGSNFLPWSEIQPLQ